jgi:hypothetical protein
MSLMTNTSTVAAGADAGADDRAGVFRSPSRTPGSIASYDARDLTSGDTGSLSTPGGSAGLSTPGSSSRSTGDGGINRSRRYAETYASRRSSTTRRTAVNFRTPVSAGNVLQELRLVEVRLLEIAAVVATMDVDTASVERGMLRRIMDSLSTGDDKNKK